MTVINATDVSGNVIGVKVDSNGFLREKLTDGTNDVTVTSNRLDVNANISATGFGGVNLWQQVTADGKGFILTTDIITISGTAVTPFLLLRNPAASGKTIRIKKICFTLVATITLDSGTYKIYRDPTVTGNGTTKTPRPIKKSQSATPVLLAGTAPTVSANGILLLAGALTSGGSFNIMDEDMCFYIEQEENIYITIQPAATGKGYGISIWFDEE